MHLVCTCCTCTITKNPLLCTCTITSAAEPLNYSAPLHRLCTYAPLHLHKITCITSAPTLDLPHAYLNLHLCTSCTSSPAVCASCTSSPAVCTSAPLPLHLHHSLCCCISTPAGLCKSPAQSPAAQSSLHLSTYSTPRQLNLSTISARQHLNLCTLHQSTSIVSVHIINISAPLLHLHLDLSWEAAALKVQVTKQRRCTDWLQ